MSPQRQRRLQLQPCAVLILALILVPPYTCTDIDEGDSRIEGGSLHYHDQDRNLYFAPYLLQGELPDGATKELFREDWRIIGYQLDTPEFTDKVAEVSKTIYSAYSFHGELHSLQTSEAAPTTLDGQAGIHSAEPLHTFHLAFHHAATVVCKMPLWSRCNAHCCTHMS